MQHNVMEITIDLILIDGFIIIKHKTKIHYPMFSAWLFFFLKLASHIQAADTKTGL